VHPRVADHDAPDGDDLESRRDVGGEHCAGSAEGLAAVRPDRRMHRHAEMLGRHEHRRAKALHLERTVELSGDAVPEPVRLEDREGDEARCRYDDERSRDGPAPAAPAPEVDDREREQDARPELRGEAEPEERTADDGPVVDERCETRDGEHGRPEVVARPE